MATAEIRDGCDDARKRKASARKKEYRESHKSEQAAWEKKWRESHKSERAARKKERVESLADSYVASVLRLPTSIIPPEMMEMKRNRILLNRELVLLKKAIKGE